MATSSNVSFKCVGEVEPTCTDPWEYKWLLNEDLMLVRGNKYDIQKRETKPKCKKEFTVTISDVSKADEGKYRCLLVCSDYNIKASSSIQLKVFTSPTGTNTLAIFNSKFSKNV